MDQPGFEKMEQKFSSPQEELNYLREQVAKHEKTLQEKGEVVPREDIITEKIIEYKSNSPEEVLHPSYQLPSKEVESIVLDLSPEEHDMKMEEMVNILQTEGLMNALSVIEGLKDAHLDDDFHRFLVQYIKAGLPVIGGQEKSPFFRALKMTLFEVSLPQADNEKEVKQKNLKELVSKMEQFYAGMISVASEEDGPDYFTIELANANRSEEFIFYVSVPDSKKGLFEKQILSIFPDARISEKKDDYNVFNEQGLAVGSYAKQGSNHIYPLKTYDQFDYDPLNVILNSFSKLKGDGEGAGIQIIFKPVGEKYTSFYKKALKDFSKGMKLKEAINMDRISFFGETKKILWDLADGFVNNKKEKDKEKGIADQKSLEMDKGIIENLNNKISTPTVETNIRIIASSNTESEALSILSDLESAFNQFENTGSNKLSFKRPEGRELRQFFREFSFRVFKDSQKVPLNLREITTIMHLPENEILGTSQFKQSKAGTAQAALDMQKKGISLGKNIHRNVETEIFMAPEDRLRHFYVIGQTGTGKTTLLKRMIQQDILNGDGVCMIDPHGSDIQDVLSYVPKERLDDLIYFDPSYTARPMGLNMLEYDVRFPEQKTFVVNEMLSIFNKLFDMKAAGGPMFEQYFRNAVMLVLDDPTSGNTLVDVYRVLSNKPFREMKLSKCRNPLVVQFWKEIADKAGGDASLANIVPYIVSKFDVFLQNDIMRPIVSQEKSAFNFREIMDNKKILLVNLSKGRLGDLNANLLGLIIVGKILMAALSRVDSKDFPPFYLYIDEFQNVTTDSISTIFSEARKYKLSLTVAHQFIAQLDEKIRDSVFGNVGSIASFRVSSEDAEYLEKQFVPAFSQHDLMNIDNLNCYVKMLSSNKPAKPFSMFIPFPPRGDSSHIEKVKELSYLKYGKDRELVDAEIMKKYEKKEVSPTVPPISSFKI